LRRRLKTPAHNLHPTWGRWLPWNRLSIDQVPCNLREGAGHTYEDTGAARVWIAGSKADDGKRFCTLQVIARGWNGSADEPRRGQPKIGVIFRGQGMRISAEENAAWHPDVDVRFQPKAWADADYCEKHAEKEMADATSAARARGEASVAFYDNLHGQTTDIHRKLLHSKAGCARHLLPTGVTSEIQLIDDGIGFAVKNKMGHELDTWLERGDNLAKWTGEGDGALQMWEKRVLITQLVAKAWDAVCETFDFQKAATRIGMNMTIDGSGDENITIQGVSDYKFCDADGGDDTGTPAEGLEPGMDPDEAAFLDSLVDEEGDGEEAEGEEEDGEEEDEEEGSSEIDDTAEPLEDQVGPALEAPAGFEFVDEVPNLETEADHKALIGRHILHAWATDTVFGWYMGKIAHFGCSTRDLSKTPSANFVVQYKKSVTKDNKLDGRVASTLTTARYGKSEWWVLLEQSS